jgi:hypothetical protein
VIYALGIALTLKLHLVLDNESLALVLNLLREFGRDSMVSSCVLDHQTLVSLHTLEDVRLLYGPLSNIRPLLILVGA